MKIKIFLASAVIVLILMIFSCTHDDYDYETFESPYSIELLTMNYAGLKNAKSDGSFWSSKEANTIAVQFLELNESERKYILNLSREEARELHIQDSDFERMISEIEMVNDSIKMWSKNKEMVIELPNPDVFIYNTLKNDSLYKVRLKSGQEQPKPGERVIQVFAVDQSWESKSAFLPMDTKLPLTVACWSTGLIPVFNIKVEAFGEVTATGVGILGSWSTTITPNCTNTYATFYFKTTHSGGGSASFLY